MTENPNHIIDALYAKLPEAYAIFDLIMDDYAICTNLCISSLLSCGSAVIHRMLLNLVPCIVPYEH